MTVFSEAAFSKEISGTSETAVRCLMLALGTHQFESDQNHSPLTGRSSVLLSLFR